MIFSDYVYNIFYEVDDAKRAAEMYSTAYGKTMVVYQLSRVHAGINVFTYVYAAKDGEQYSVKSAELPDVEYIKRLKINPCIL